MQGNYAGIAPFLVSPFQRVVNAGLQVTFAEGTPMSSNDTTDFGNAIQVAQTHFHWRD